MDSQSQLVETVNSFSYVMNKFFFFVKWDIFKAII